MYLDSLLFGLENGEPRSNLVGNMLPRCGFSRYQQIEGAERVLLGHEVTRAWGGARCLARLHLQQVRPRAASQVVSGPLEHAPKWRVAMAW